MHDIPWKLDIMLDDDLATLVARSSAGMLLPV